MKRVFLFAIAVFEAGNVISATANSSATLILGRIVAGAGGGGVMTGSFIIIALSAKPQYRAAYMGVLGVTFGCASVVGPLLGGVLTDSYLTWRWCFWYVAFNREPLENSPVQDKSTHRGLCCNTHDLIFQSTHSRPADPNLVEAEDHLTRSTWGFSCSRSVKHDGNSSNE